MKRGGAVTSGAAAFAVVVVIVLAWWLLSGNGPGGLDGNADRLDVAGEATPPAGSGTSAGDPGDGSVPTRGAAEQPSDEDGARDSRSDRGVRIDGYVLEAPDRLALNYTTGVPACAGRLATPSVVEDAIGVRITLATVPPPKPADVCIELAVQKTVRITLDAPLDGRAVLDGSVDPAENVERVAAAYN